jgi:hypothetical protein
MGEKPTLDFFPRTSTPYTLCTELVRDLIAFVTRRAQLPFEEAMITLELTDFFLYAAYAQQCGSLHTLYSFDQPFCRQLWGHDTAPARVAEVLQEALTHRGPLFATHRRALRAYAHQAAQGNALNCAALRAFWQAAQVADATQTTALFAQMSKV